MHAYGLGVRSNQSTGLFSSYLIICGSILAAMVLSMLPLPSLLGWIRPLWVGLVLVYWVIALPHRVGVISAWVAGLLQDVLHANVLGQDALALSLVAFLAYTLHLRVRVFPLWQQMLTVFILMGFLQLTQRVVQGLVGDVAQTPIYWLPTLISALIWPLVFWVMNQLCHKCQVH